MEKNLAHLSSKLAKSPKHYHPFLADLELIGAITSFKCKKLCNTVFGNMAGFGLGLAVMLLKQQ